MEKLIKGFNHHTITENGIVRNIKTNHVLTPNIRKNGYYLISINEFGVMHKRYLHRILAEAFIPNPDNKRTINHIDGNKLNNALSNLEWATDSENLKHAYKLGLICSRARITLKDAEIIYSRFMKGENLTLIQKDYNIVLSQISKLVNKYVNINNLQKEFTKEKRRQKSLRQCKKIISTTISKESRVKSLETISSLKKDEDIV